MAASLLFIAPHVHAVGPNDITVFRKPLFDFVLPNATPSQNERTNSLEISASPDEYEPATFVVRANTQNIPNVSVTASDLVSGSNRISKNNIDIRVVKVWKQAGLGQFVDYPKEKGVLVPELLVYDDGQTLVGSFDANGKYTAPTLLETLRTNIPKNSAKQFWVTVHVPPNTPSGTYKTNLVLQANGTEIQNLPFTVNVLPIKLEEPKQTYAIYYIPGLYSTVDMVQKELTDIRQHGFNGLQSGTNTNITILDIIKNSGFINPVLKNTTRATDSASLASSVAALNKAGFKPYLYGVDEPNDVTAKLPYHIRRSFDIHTAGGVGYGCYPKKYFRPFG
jgi:hypothetical protein